MKKRSYFSCHNHTEFSNLKIIDSTNRFDRMIDYAWDLGLSGIALTDHDCLSGTLRALKIYRKKLEKEWSNKFSEPFPGYEQASQILDFKVALGNEIYLSEEGINSETMKNGESAHFWHLILIAKDYEGFNQLKRLSSAAWSRAWVRNLLRTPTYPSDLMKEVQGGHLVATTACLGGYLAWTWKEYVASKDSFWLEKMDNHLAAMQELFGIDNFYIEVQPNEIGSEQNAYNEFMIKRYWGKYSFIFSTDTHYLKEDERGLHKAFLNSKTSKDRETDEFYKYTYMMSAEEVRSLMPYVSDIIFEEMVSNTNKIKNMCNYYEIEQGPQLAKVEYEYWDEYEKYLELFNDITAEKHPNFYWFMHADNKPANYLVRLVAHGFYEKQKDDWNREVYLNRLEEEFWTLKEVGDKIEQPMADYFITMSKIIDICWDDAETIVGPSRGSAGALLINYLLGITQMDPVKLELPFVWRFLHPSRPDLPDIDFDTESDKRGRVFNAVQKYFNSIGGEVVNVCTFGTEGTKSALRTASRGLNIDDDVITYITAMIPNERGYDWTLDECYYGNEENDRKPIRAFIQQMEYYPRLWELARNIEGLITRLGVHASGVVCVNDDFTKYNSFMKTSRGQIVTSYDLHDLEECGLVKYDFLTVSALDRIRQTLNYMLEDGTIEWQGSLRKTYDKYIHPSVLIYDDPTMWDMVGNSEVNSLFQFDTLVGSQAIKDIQPRSLQELAISSSLMRLMSDGELPLEKYAKFKRAPALWYDEMKFAGLNQKEMAIMEKHLKRKSGIAESQESIMQISMDPEITGFDMLEANKLRKTIAKKQFREIEEVKAMFYEKGNNCGTRKELLDYVWKYQVESQLGYSFSEIHTTGYALIALQEMNLAFQFPIIYWNCACLSVDSSAINEADFESLIEEDIITIDEEEEKKVQTKMNYAKMAEALDRFKKISTIRLPDINKSRLGFTPDVASNTILYGLKGITMITDPTIEEIMNNRPFTSLKDFYKNVTRKVVNKAKIINLIKCGAFNELEKKPIKDILEDFIWMICEPKKKLTLQNANMLIDFNLLPENLQYQADVYKLTKELRKNRDPLKLWYCGDRLEIPYNKFETWQGIIKDSQIKPQDLLIENEPRRVISSEKWDVFYNSNMNKIRDYIKNNHDELLEKLNNRLFQDEYDKYCSGDELQWQLDSLNFYFDEHPLIKVSEQIIDKLGIEINAVQDIVEGLENGSFYIKGKVVPRMKLYTIAGTVIDRDKTKGLVTLQCPSGVVNVKVYKDLYAMMTQVFTEDDVYGNRNIIQDSFFEKGVHLLITGIQRGATFVPKVYKATGRNHIVRIVLDENGDFVKLEDKMV